MASLISKALHNRIDTTSITTVVTPIYQCSAFPADSPYFYTRKNNPNISEIETVMTVLEEAEHCVGFSTGMAAINSLLNLLQPSATIVVNRDIYGCSLKLFIREAERMKFKLALLDLSDPDEFSKIPEDTALVFFETPTNPFLKTVDIRSLSEWVNKVNDDTLIVVDNTWASPLFQHPLTLGADVSIHSATKYISGHSDVMGGFALCKSPDVAEAFREVRFYGGAVMDPNSAWLLRRSIQTLPMRMNCHVATLVEMADFLERIPLVEKVYLPTVDGHQLKNYGGILFFDLQPEFTAAYEQFRNTLQLFGSGTGMAAVTSMIAQPYTGSHASLNDMEKAQMGLGRQLVRLSFGLEPTEDLKTDLSQAFTYLSTLAPKAKIETIS